MELRKNPDTQAAPDSVQVLQSAKQTYSAALFLLAIYGILCIVLVYGTAWICRLIAGQRQITGMPAMLINMLPMYLGAFPIFLFLSKGMEKHPPEKKKLSPGKWCCYLIIGISLMMLGNLIGTAFNYLLTKLIGVQTASTALSEAIFSEDGYVMVIFAVLGAPIVEELIFRKVLIDRVRHFGDGTAILLSGLFFGLFHGNFSQFFYAMFLGFMLAAIYIKTGNILYTILIHLTVNSIGSLVPLLLMNTMPDETKQMLLDTAINGNSSLLPNVYQMLGDLAPYLYFVELEYAASFAGIILLLVFFNDFRSGKLSVLPKGQGIKTALLNIGSITMFAFCVFQFIMQIASNT